MRPCYEAGAQRDLRRIRASGSSTLKGRTPMSNAAAVSVLAICAMALMFVFYVLSVM